MSALYSADFDQVLDSLDSINPKSYASTRNFLDGNVTRLSPFLTHGILSTRDLGEAVLRQFSPEEAYKFLAELAWREFFHRVWQHRGEEIFSDLKQPQSQVASSEMPVVFCHAKTGIKAIDDSIKELLDGGYMHNHARMWLASLVCNIGETHWSQPSQWLYYHLLDGDLASNTLSWQWIAGSFSHKKYIANQDNVNRYSRTEQFDTEIDITYEDLAKLKTPLLWQERAPILLEPTTLPKSDLSAPLLIKENQSKSIALHSAWNLDPRWRTEADRKILVLEPSHFEHHPISSQRMDFILHWANLIPNVEIFVGEIDELISEETLVNTGITIWRKEYPLCQHWPGEVDQRDWLYPETTKLYASFSSYWRNAQKEVGLDPKKPKSAKKRKLHQ